MQRVLLPLLLMSAAAAQRRVWVVDLAGGPGVHFTQINTAVAAATEGDRIEVRGTGPYPPFTLTKGLDVEAVANARVLSCEVTGIAAGRVARVAGFRVQFDLSFRLSAPVWVHDCAGSVLFASFDCTSTGLGLRAERCAAILVVDSSFRGVSSMQQLFSGAAPGIWSRSAPILLQRSLAQGGNGESASLNRYPTAGSVGCDVDSPLIVVASTLRGGYGGDGGRMDPRGQCYVGADGSAGLVARGRCVVMEGSQLAGGAGGNSGGCGGGNAGASLVGSPQDPAAVTTDCVRSGAAAVNIVVIPTQPTTTTPAQANLGQPVVTTVRGGVGAPALVFMDFDHSHTVIAGIPVPLLLRPAAMFPIASGIVGGNGTFVYSIPIPLDPVLRNEFVFQQSVVVSNLSVVELSSLADLRLR